MGDAIDRARQKVHDQIAAQEGRTSSGEQSASDRGAEYQRREEVPATKNQIDRDERKRQFDAERNRPSPNEQADSRKEAQDYREAQRKKERHEEFNRTRKVEKETREGAAERRYKDELAAEQEKVREAKELQKRAAANKPAEPMLPFGELMRKKATGVKNEFVKRTKDSFINELKQPGRSIQEGRRVRREQQESPLGSFWATPAPRAPRATRNSKMAPMGTGFLFSEGFLNPPKGKTGRKKKGTGKSRGTFGMGDMLL